MPNPFLSEEWMADVRAIRERHAGETPEITTVLKINQVINDVPFGDGTVETYLDTSSGQMVMEFGQLETPDVTITTDYATARTMFVDQDQAAAMQAFMAGKVVVQGDMMKLMAMQTAIPRNDITEQVAEEIKAVTA